ncbi:alpha-L-fucosidase [Chitinophagaceae bacterium LWZ2-11]
MKTQLLLFGLCFLSVQALYAQENYVIINPGESEASIIQKAAHVTPIAKQLRWQQLELTAFFHFGMNTFTGNEWGNGKEDTKLFNPTELDAKQWVKTCKDAGFKQVIITAKHHDGFCLWPSKYTEHSVKNSPWKNGTGDVVKEVSEACKTYKIGFGIYLSPWDRNSALYGTEEYNDYFVNQLTELLTNYGKVDEVWFDGANGEGPNGKKQVYDFTRWYGLIRKLQPQAVIAIMGPDVRWVGTETGKGRETEWSVVPANNLDANTIADNSQKGLSMKPLGNLTGQDIGSRDKIKNAKALVWYPAETDVSIRPGWFYHAKEDDKIKTPEQLRDIYYSSVGRNSVLLLNIPPDTRGLLSDSDVNHLKGFKTLLNATFSNNLLKNAAIQSPEGKKITTQITDGKYTSYWQANDSIVTLDINLKRAETFSILMLQENIAIGQRVEKFVLEALVNNEWTKVTEGTTIGYKRLLRFNAVTAQKVRLRITASRLNPTIAEMGIYK